MLSTEFHYKLILREKERTAEQQISFLWFEEPPASLYMHLRVKGPTCYTAESSFISDLLSMLRRVSAENSPVA